MNSLLENIKKTIKLIQGHPDVIVDEVTINSPIAGPMAEALKTVSGIRIPSDIKEFYQAANGITFIWRIKQESDNLTKMKIKEKIGDEGYDLSKPLGALRILPLEDMLLNTKWAPIKDTDPDANAPVSFGGTEYTFASVSNMPRPFDFHDPDTNFQSMSFVI